MEQVNNERLVESFINDRLTPYLVCPIAWILTWWMQSFMTLTVVNTGINLVFFPAGVRALSVFVFGLRGAIGVFIGTSVTSMHYFSNENSISIVSMMLISLVSSFTSYFVMKLVCKYRGISDALCELRFSDILLIVCTQGVISPLLHLLIYDFAGLNGHIEEPLSTEIQEFFYMSAGDIVGSMIFMLTFTWIATHYIDTKSIDRE